MACHIDFRCLDEGFGGKTYKRKRSLLEQQYYSDAATEMDVELVEEEEEKEDINSGSLPPKKRQAVSSSEGRPTYDGVIAGKVSGRNWKQVRKQRASAIKKKATTTRTKTEEERKKEKEMKKAYQERMKELKGEINQRKEEKRKKREEREKRKEENILRTGTKLQKITNPKTLKKISKSAKQRKFLKVLPTSSTVTTS